jgi:sialidase-1
MRSFAYILALALFASPLFSTRAADDADVRPLSPELREKCLAVLRTALEGEEFWPAMHAAEALTLAGEGKSVVPLLEARLKTDQDPQHRCGLVREIVRTGKREPLAILWKTLADTKSNGRVHAAESLYKIGEVGDGKLLRAAMQVKDDPKLQIMSAAALGRAGNQQAMELVREKLKSDDHELRKLAAWVLGLLGNSQDIAAIGKLRDSEADPVTQSFFVNSMACLGDAKARETLAKNIDSADPAIRTYAADFAAWSRSLNAVKMERLNDTNVDVRVRTAQALLVFSLPRHILGLPLAVAGDDIQVDVFPASAKYPRYSEGSLITLRDGSLLYATTEFVGGGADHATASIVAKTSKDGGRTWSDQRTLQENIGKQNVMSVTLSRLSHEEATSPLGMFFLQKNSQTDLKVLLRISQDEGQTFGEPSSVSSGPGYHIMNNDRVTLLSSGRLICPISWTDDIFKKGSHLVCFCFLSEDGGLTWKRSAGQVDQPGRGAMEPEVVELVDGKLMMIIRTQLGHIATSLSEDGGDHWSAPSSLPLESPEAPATIRAIPATGDLLLAWNNTYDKSKGHGGDRTPLTSAISSDGGKTWSHVRNLETDRQHTYAYTSLLFYKDRVLLSYYVSDNKSGRISSRFRSLPVRWFYEDK